MKRIFLLFSTIFSLSSAYSQCGLSIPWQINVCGDSCVGRIHLKVTNGIVPLTFITPTDTVMFTNPNTNDFSI
ncbi:MAG: hypothetical protein AB8B72_07320 [Crocinitomicaceae bacterium]